MKNHETGIFSYLCEGIVKALNKMVEIFTTHDGKSLDEVMSNGLQFLSDAAGIDRVVIFRHSEMDGSLGQVYLWHGKTLPLEKELLVLPDEPTVNNWVERLKKGECINGNLIEMSEEESALLGKYGIKSILFVPIFTHGEFWGFITLEDHTHYRRFKKSSLDLLRTAAHLCTNIVTQDEMERKITGADDYNRATLDAAPIGFTVLDEDLNIIDCNDTTAKRLGCSKQYYKEHFFEFSPDFQPDGQNSTMVAMEHIKNALAGEKQVFKWIHRTLSGELVPFEITLTRTRHNGRHLLLAYQYDLSNINSLEKAIAEAEELTRAVTEASPFPYVLFNKDMQPIDCNEAILRILEAPDKQYFLEHYWDVFLPDIQPDGTNSYKKATEAHKNALISRHTTYEWYHRSMSGEEIPMESSVSKITHKGSVYFISFKYDLRSIKKMMNNISEQSELLKEAFLKATDASRVKSEFLSNMSHEMRTPLNAIIGMTTIGKNTPNPERKDYALNKIVDASNHLLGVINDILDMSKIEANKFEFASEEFNFEMMLHKVVNFVNFRVEEKKQKFSVHIDPSIPKTLIGDDQRIAQVITNLLANAAKFTPENGSISLSTKLLECENKEGSSAEERNTDSSYTIQISVADTGIGINPEQQERLFDSFTQAESNTTRKYGGTGLGLSISKNIVELMGGRIWVCSEPGKGSIFSFTIKAMSGREKKKNLLNPDINWSNVRVMAVDDDPDILEQFRDIMSGFGVSCDTAKDHKEAFALIERNGPYNIYFIDWKMSGMDGIELTRVLKSESHISGNAVAIMISAAEWREIEDEAEKVGVDKFLSKPLFPSTIMNTINELFGIQQQEEESAEITGIFEGRHILLAEDVEINREIVLELLAPTKLIIDCAENGAEAVRMYSETPEKYEMIFMDLHMPIMDGYEATRTIRAFEASRRKTSGKPFKQIPIVAMTANVFREDAEKCIKAGMNGHIGKPLDFNLVMNKLRNYLLNRRTRLVLPKNDSVPKKIRRSRKVTVNE